MLCNGEMEKCACCGDPFLKRKDGKGYERTGIHTNYRTLGSVANVIQKLYGVQVTPSKDTYLCNKCTALITSINKTVDQLEESESRLRKVKLAGGYISTKIVATPFKSSFSKRRKYTITTPHKSPQKTPVIKPVVNVRSSNKTEEGTLPQKNISLTVNNTRIGKAVANIAKGRYLTGFRELWKNSKTARNAAVHVMEDEIRKEVTDFAHATSEDTSIDDMFNFNWNVIIQKAVTVSPILTALLTSALTTKQRQKNRTKKKGSKIISVAPVLGALISIIGFQRSVRSSIFQQLNSVMMWLGGCKRKVFGSFNRLGLCLSINATRSRIDKYKQNYDSKVLEWKTAISDVETGMIVEDDDDDQWDDILDQWEEMDQSAQERPSVAESGSESTQLEQLRSSELDHTSRTEDTIPYIEAEELKEEPAYYDITFDNVNQKIGVRHHFRGKENKMLNMVQAYASKDRISMAGFSNDLPSAEVIRDIPISAFLLTDDDETLIKEELEIVVKRILTTHVPCFRRLKDQVTWSIPHLYQAESLRKTEIVPLGVEQKDETKTAEVIELLDIYKNYVPKKRDGSPLPLLLYCDGLSCERVDGAQKARINGGDSWARLEMFEPGIQEWHKRLLHMQDTFDTYFRFESHREKGTLFNIKQIYDYRGVSKNVMECFNKAEELLEFTTTVYVILAMMNILEFKTIDDELDADDKSFELSRVAEEIVTQIYPTTNTKEILNVSSDKSLDPSIYCICKLESGGEMVYCGNRICKFGQWFHLDCIGVAEDDIPEGDWFCSDICQREHTSSGKGKRKQTIDMFRDLQKEYVEGLLWRGLNEMIRHDAIKENDGIRMIRHWKADLPDLYENNHPKYLIYAHRLLINIAGATSPRMRAQLTWNRTVNVEGGHRKNIPKDLHCEHLNRQYKENCRDAGGQLTPATISRHSQMLGLGKVLEKVYQEQVVETRVQVRKHAKPTRNADVRHLVKMLHPLALFTFQQGRSFKGFENLKSSKGVTFPRKFKERLMRYTEKMANRRELAMDN